MNYGNVVNAVERLGLKGFEKITLKEELDPTDTTPENVALLAAAAEHPVTSSTCTPGLST